MSSLSCWMTSSQSSMGRRALTIAMFSSMCLAGLDKDSLG